MSKPFAPTILKHLLLCQALVIAGIAQADEHEFSAALSGAQEVVLDEQGNLVTGGTDTAASGRIHALFNDAFTELRVNLKIENLVGNFTAAHFHCGRPGENGPVAFGMVGPGPLVFDGMRIEGTLTNLDYTGADCVEIVGRPINNLVSLAFAMRDGLVYANVHSDVFPAGEIRGQMEDADDDLDDDPDDDPDDDNDDDDDDGGWAY
jgi:CHRD domain